MFTKTLYGKIALVLSGLFLLIGLLYIVLTLFTTRYYIQEGAQRLNHDLAAYLVSQMSFIEDKQINQNALKKSFDMLMKINHNIEVYLLDPEGKILAYSAPPGKVKRYHVSLEPVKSFLENIDNLPILGDDPRNQGLQKVFSAAPIPPEGPLEGYLYIILGSEEYDNVAQMLQKSYILRLSTGVAAAGLLFVFVTGLFLFRSITGRLRKLTVVMDSFKRKDFLEPVSFAPLARKDKGDEIDRLEEVFQDMSSHIIKQMDKIRQSDIQRRELISNISHDLRTPLTSLQGYLETVQLKGEQTIPQELMTYLETALNHSKRLGKLISELFELAKLDAHDMEVRLEPFHIGELVQDVAQKLQLSADKKKITMQTQIPENLPFVSADIGLIERAIQNLLDNALRCTPEGGKINMALECKESKVYLSIEDTGCGIQPKDIPFIFDRFYCIDQEDSGSSGLGLAITKRIIELHGSQIDLHSELRVGTIFSFHLPVSIPPTSHS